MKCWGLTDSPIPDNLKHIIVDLTRPLRKEMRKSDRNRNLISVGSGASYSAVHGFAVGTRDVTLQTASGIAYVLGVQFSSRKQR